MHTVALMPGDGIGPEIINAAKQVIEAAARVTKGDIPISLGQRRPGDPAILLADITRATGELEWKPVRSNLDRIIASAWEWHRKSWKISAA